MRSLDLQLLDIWSYDSSNKLMGLLIFIKSENQIALECFYLSSGNNLLLTVSVKIRLFLRRGFLKTALPHGF